MGFYCLAMLEISIELALHDPIYEEMCSKFAEHYAYIAAAINERAPQARLAHFPLVGVLPADAWPPPAGPQRSMPSGGLVTNWNVRQLVRDLGAGLALLTWRQARFLASQRQRDVIVAVGDVYCLALCNVFARRPSVFVATAKSEYVAPHWGIEAAIARRAALTFARDEPTAAALRKAGVNARYAGNVMMDGLQPSGIDLGRLRDALHVAVLPGSRADAPANAELSTKRLRALAQIVGVRGRSVQAFFSSAASVQDGEIQAAIARGGVALAPRTGGVITAAGSMGTLQVLVVRGAFADMLNAADVVFGQAGTGNEQAAGLGKPVIAAAQPGEVPERMYWYRMRQKRLLGDALLVLPGDPDEFARGVAELLADPKRLEHMRATGRQRMGGPGGAAAVAAAVLALSGGAAA